MPDTLTYRDLLPRSFRDRALLTALLEVNGLRYEEDIEGGIGAFAGTELVGCGCFSKNILKCFAVSESQRGNNVLGTILSRIMDRQFERGLDRLGVYTKPENKTLFEACGLHTVCETQSVAFLENVPCGISSFAADALLPEDRGREAGALVMNCNPFTWGHRCLVEYATERSDVVYLFVVEEDRSIFPYAVRKELVIRGVADLPNVRVLGSGPYMISSGTFPTYFLKRESDAARVQAEFDATLFASRIAPAFGIRRRYAGNEPLCPMTRRYNDAMHAVLPRHGIEYEEIPRLAEAGKAVSASRVRDHIRSRGVDNSLAALVPPTTLEFLRGPEGEPVIAAIRA